MALKPQQQTPDLTIDTLGGTPWTLSAQQPEHFTMIVFYRGYHCPLCKMYLSDLEKKRTQFIDRGVEVIAISSNPRELAEKSKREWHLDHLPIGYGLPIDTARAWGLFISKGINETEPEYFSEPALFLIQPDRTLYAAAIQTMPFARPNFQELLGAIDFITANQYPGRGEA